MQDIIYAEHIPEEFKVSLISSKKNSNKSEYYCLLTNLVNRSTSQIFQCKRQESLSLSLQSK